MSPNKIGICVIIYIRIFISKPRFNNGEIMPNMIKDRKRERKLMNIDSPKCCPIKEVLLAPTVFLMPTSFARVEDLAVDKFIKLNTAIRMIKKAIADNEPT
jgi:hypothetical protein